MLSIKDYAKQNNITYEAVRQQIKRYRDQLDDHIIQDGRTQYLDDIAVAFLDEKRQKNPVVVYQQGKDETIEELQQEVTRLLRKQEALRDQIDDLKEYKRLAEEQRHALEDAKTAQERRKQELLLREAAMDEEVEKAVQEATEAQKTTLDELRAQEVQKVRQEAQKAAEDAEHLHQQELSARDAKIRAWEKYAADVAAYEAMSKWQRWRQKVSKPAPPIEQEKTHESESSND